MEIKMNPLQRQMLDDVFDAFTMLIGGGMVSLMHVDGGYTRYTPAAVELFGLPGEYIPNGAMDWSDYLHPDDRKKYMDVMIPLLEGKTQTYDITYRVKTAQGGYQLIRAVGAVLRGADGKPSLIGGAMFNENITSIIDPITILPTNEVYLDDLAKMISESKKTFSLQVGISQFARINKVHGYTYGNRIIQEMAWQIQEAVGNRGKVYRGDGANFLILTDTMTRENVAALYDYIRYQFQRGIEINGVNNILTANGGMVSTTDALAEARTIYSCLNYSCDESKNNMHGELVDFNGTIDLESAEFLEMIAAMRKCILDNCAGFQLEYLPVMDAKSGNINGVEALLCWQDEKFGKVAEEKFISVLERDFLFEELGDFILQTGLTDAKKFSDAMPGFYMCLNVYRLQLESDYFVENLLYYLQESKFPPELLSLKFDSTCRFIGIERMKQIISELHEHKILVILDDFGSGVDSIGFLKSEPIDAVSIAGQFTEDFKTDTRTQETLKLLAEIAANYVKHINVKNISDAEVKSVVEKFSVTTLQGDYFFKPMSFETALEICAKFRQS